MNDTSLQDTGFVCGFKVSRRLCGLLLLGMLSACSVNKPVEELAPEDVPSNWQNLASGAPEGGWPTLDWWQNFDDEELSGIIAGVKANNLDLANNARNLEAAQLNLREAGFNLLPVPVVTIGTGARFIEDSAAPSGADRRPSQPFDLNAGFTWNDILSRPAVYERAMADYDARVAQIADVALNTLGTTASTYFQLLLTRDKIEAAQQNVSNAEAIGEIANARVEAGVAVPIEALQQQIAIERERNNLRSFIQNDLSARASLALLLGRSVQDFNVAGQSLEAINIPTVTPGLPSELLRRRPDMVQAEANLRASSANVDVVYSDLFPQISLTGNFGASSTSLSTLLSSPDGSLVISANLVQTLLDNGQRYRNLEQARLTMANSLSSYRKTVLGAFNDIEVLLSNLQLLQAQGETSFENLQAAEESFRIAQVRYEEGVTDFQTVLTAQNTLFSSRNAYLDNKLLQLNAVVGFYQALGGGWQAEEAELLP